MSGFDILGQSKSKGSISLSDKQIVTGIWLLNQEGGSISMRECDLLMGWDGYGVSGKVHKSQIIINQLKDKYKKNKSIESHTGGKTAEELKKMASEFLVKKAEEFDVA